MSRGATPELRELDAFRGRWSTTGRVLAGSPEDEVEIVGNDTYRWLAGGHFMTHRVDVLIGDERVRNLEVIGYDPAENHYRTRFFDHEGNTGTYVAEISEGVWTFSTEGARAELTIDPDGRRMTARWEKSTDDGSWQPWMELEFTKSESSTDDSHNPR